MNVRQLIAGIRWYLREVSGEARYDRYLAHARQRHGDAAVLSRREFERRRTDALEAAQVSRCC